jgi:hypothetical protein
MPVVPCLRTWLPGAALLALCLAAAAAPAPEAKAVSEKYLPDDADAVLVINVKEVAASPLYARHFQKKLQELLRGEAIPKWVKDLETAVPRDVDRLTLVLGRNSFGGPNEPHLNGPTIILEGRPAVLWDMVKQLAKDMPQAVKEQKVGDFTVYQISPPAASAGGFVAMPDGKTLVFAPRKEQMADVLDKAAGTKTTRLTSKALRDMLAGMKPIHALQFAATGDLITGGSSTTTTVMGKQVTEVKHTRLAETGIDSARGHFRAGEKLEGRVTLTAKDEETAKGMAQAATAGLDQLQPTLERAIESQKDRDLQRVLKAVRDSLKTVKVGSRGREITFEGQASPEALEGVPLMFMPVTLRQGPPPPPPAPKKP